MSQLATRDLEKPVHSKNAPLYNHTSGPSAATPAALKLQQRMGNRAISQLLDSQLPQNTTRTMMADAATVDEPLLGGTTETQSAEGVFESELLPTSSIANSENTQFEKEEDAKLAPAFGLGQANAAVKFRGNIIAAFNYIPNVTPRDGPIPVTAFGNTFVDRPGYRLANRNFLHFGVNQFVNADLHQDIFWNVRQGIGWNNQVNINSSADPNITMANYREVARDLTPNINGRPPRVNFWAQDLTEDHEQGHVDQIRQFARDAIAKSVAWLSTKRANTDAALNALLDAALVKIDAFVDRKSKQTARNEKAAYSAGAGNYRGRARSIRARGKRGDYPP